MDHYLLCREVFIPRSPNKPRVQEWVAQYSDNDMAEIFTAPQRALLAAGKPLAISDHAGTTTYIDMTVTARAARGQA